MTKLRTSKSINVLKDAEANKIPQFFFKVPKQPIKDAKLIMSPNENATRNVVITTVLSHTWIKGINNQTP